MDEQLLCDDYACLYGYFFVFVIKYSELFTEVSWNFYFKEHFGGKEVNTSIDAEEAVVMGAAIEAAILSGNKSVDMQSSDTLPLSLGMNILISTKVAF